MDVADKGLDDEMEGGNLCGGGAVVAAPFTFSCLGVGLGTASGFLFGLGIAAGFLSSSL